MWIKNYAKTDFDPLTPPILKGTIESVPTQLAHRAGSMGWPFPVLKYKYILQIKCTEAIFALENCYGIVLFIL